jgi:trimeric autotransporter adhesin
MKQIWPDYSYSPATNVLTLTGLNIDRDQLLLVAAPERGRIMYNFADSSVTASAFTSGANTSLTLVATTAGLTTTAALVIYYDDQLQSTSVSISNFPATQTIAGTVTVGSLPAISGTVTANLSSSNLNTVTIGVRGSVTVGNTTQITDNVVAGFNNTFGNNDTLKVDIRTPDGSVLDGEASVPVQGTVDIGSLPAISGTVTVGNSVTIGSLPAISGTVTANTVYATNVTGNAGLVASTVTAIPVALVDRGVYGGA